MLRKACNFTKNGFERCLTVIFARFFGKAILYYQICLNFKKNVKHSRKHGTVFLHLLVTVSMFYQTGNDFSNSFSKIVLFHQMSFYPTVKRCFTMLYCFQFTQSICFDITVFYNKITFFSLSTCYHRNSQTHELGFKGAKTILHLHDALSTITNKRW